jgi:hypothetical protein
MKGTKAWPAVAAIVLAVAAGSEASAPKSAIRPQAIRPQATAAKVHLLAARRRESRLLLRKIEAMRHETYGWQRVMGRSPSPNTDAARHVAALDYRRWALTVWTGRARRARRLANHPPHLQAWLCIHHYEGDWRDPSGPYYGGLQMDLEFQRTYGGRLFRRKGTADHWTPLEQIWVAEKAYESGRGFYPWPNTARYCGLI